MITLSARTRFTLHHHYTSFIRTFFDDKKNLRIPGVFGGGCGINPVTSVTDWHQLIITDKTYACECLVERVELCRCSSVGHEFLVVQIRHYSTKSLTLLKIERSVETVYGPFTYLFDDSVTSTHWKTALPKSWGNYDILYTLDFDVRSRSSSSPTVSNLAKLVFAVSQLATKHGFSHPECYSFACTIFRVLSDQFEEGQEKAGRKASQQGTCCTSTINVKDLVDAATYDYQVKRGESSMPEEKATGNVLRDLSRRERRQEIEELGQKLKEARRRAVEVEKKYQDLLEKVKSGQIEIPVNQ
ncbi:hypothetical protein BJ138DRAFT_1117441 [Hygrophoropsis aurantiaca]|uniref:Uncharacterized protein n=1 Tax=Hygrophoropsis aurantiaca TaxID=72124 RepID=A0ACB7ZZS5_9AGAM|nr:hypothetical protein BJ138DRAFT_1117441 [Hygrophoropsis aurantiaca]